MTRYPRSPSSSLILKGSWSRKCTPPAVTIAMVLFASSRSNGVKGTHLRERVIILLCPNERGWKLALYQPPALSLPASRFLTTYVVLRRGLRYRADRQCYEYPCTPISRPYR